jgi:hypothetical protein
VIRFSAGLVVVAIGVLCVGGVTSKLSLVYAAIAVSAFALIVLAIGVVLKREELFGDLKPEELLGDGSELVPAGAGTSAGSSAVGQPVAAPQPPASSPGYGLREGGFNAAAFPSGTQVRPTWTPKEGEARPDQDRATAPVGGWGSTSTPPFGTPFAAPRAWDGAKDAKQPPAPPSGPAGTGAPSADAGSSGALRSWFDRPAAPAAPVGTSAGADIPADEDDDWPTRYSWLDDEEADEAVEADDVPLESDDAVAAEVQASDLPAPAEHADAVQADAEHADAEQADAEEAVASLAAHTALEGTDAADEPPVLSSLTDPDPADPAETGKDEPSAEAQPSAEHDEPSGAEQDSGANDSGANDSGAKMVTVVPGVPRYHEPDCILIRFMPENDVKQKSIPEAKAANCTPCAACQPEG